MNARTLIAIFFTLLLSLAWAAARPESTAAGSGPVIVQSEGKVTLLRDKKPVSVPLAGLTIAPADELDLATGSMLAIRFPDGSRRIILGRRFLLGKNVRPSTPSGIGTSKAARTEGSAGASALAELQRVLERRPRTVIGGVRGGSGELERPRLQEEILLALGWAGSGYVQDQELTQEDRQALDSMLEEEWARNPRLDWPETVPRLAALLKAWGQRGSAVEMFRNLLDEGEAVPEPQVAETLRAHLREQFLPLTARAAFVRRDAAGRYRPWPSSALEKGETVEFTFSAPFPVYWSLCYWDGKTLYRNDSHSQQARDYCPEITEQVDANTPNEVFYILVSADRDAFEDTLGLDRAGLDHRSVPLTDGQSTGFGALVIRLQFSAK